MFKNKAVVLLAGICILMSGCATVDPIQKKYQDLDALYASGQITAYEYATAKEKVVREELERAKAKSESDEKASHAKREDRQ